MAARWGTSPARRLEELPQIEPPVNVCRRDPRLPLVRNPGETLSTTRQILLWIRGRQLGGRLHSYGRVLLRSSDHEFKAASHDGRGDDWPISYADVEPYYEGGGVPRNLRDNGESAQPSRREVPGAIVAHQVRAGVQAHGREPLARAALVPWRYAAPNLHRVPLGIVARETGRLTTRTDAVVRQITVNPRTGRADGAVFVDRLTKREHRVFADVVVLCASAIESVRLLPNSACEGNPNGLGNSQACWAAISWIRSPSLLFGSDPRHPGFETIDPAPADPYYAPVGGIYIPRFHNLDDASHEQFARGSAVRGTAGRLPVRGLMGFGEMLPYYDNRITVHARRTDAWGIPIPKIRLAITGQ
jgi:choline dehydrogenase-like flavoprotein